MAIRSPSRELRQKFVNYFASSRGHEHIRSSPLIPDENDNSLLFTNSGMVQFKDVFLGLRDTGYRRATSFQKCIRAGGKHNDLENVGFTDRHHTFFEMLGNFSFGDYFKEEAIVMAHEFVVKELGINEKDLRITVLNGDNESARLWRKVLHPSVPIHELGHDDNFWTMGDGPGIPCGPCSEVFIDRGDSIEDPDKRYLEIWNLVFMQNIQDGKGGFSDLPRKCVDTGMGLERIASVLQGEHLSNFETDLFTPLVSQARDILRTDKCKFAERVIADHIRAAAFLIADGVTPSNIGRGYVLRRIIRRAVGFAHKNGIREPFLCKLLPTLNELMGDAYPELTERETIIRAVISSEESIFFDTLDRGMHMLIKSLHDNTVDAEFVFKMYDTYGFPLDLTQNVAAEHGVEIDVRGFEALMNEQRMRSTSAGFGGGASRVQVQCGATGCTFVGYDELSTHDSKVLEKGDGWLILDKTPFYPRGGGQVGDIGKLVNQHGHSCNVVDTEKQVDNIILHVDPDNTLQVGDCITAAVDLCHRKQTSVHHTATHLLHSALHKVLGAQVLQAGSHVDANRLRFDVTYNNIISDEEIAKIEEIVNQSAQCNVPVHTETMSMSAAKERNAMMLFGEKYNETGVRVVQIGSESAELCGGTHVHHSLEVFPFKITSQSSVAAGTRRIEAVAGVQAVKYLNERLSDLVAISKIVNAPLQGVVDQVTNNRAEFKNMESNLKAIRSEMLANRQSPIVSHDSFAVHRVPDAALADAKAVGMALKLYSGRVQKDWVAEFSQPVHFILCKDSVVCLVRDGEPFNAGQLLQKSFEMCGGGKGGGGALYAQGKIEDTFDVNGLFKLF